MIKNQVRKGLFHLNQSIITTTRLSKFLFFMTEVSGIKRQEMMALMDKHCYCVEASF